MHVHVGSLVDPTIDGVPVILHIVGRTIEPDNDGDVVDFGLDALPGASAAAPMFYRLVLKPGVDPRRRPGPACCARRATGSTSSLRSTRPPGSGWCAW